MNHLINKSKNLKTVMKYMLITLRQLLDHAAENEYGLPAFNINNLEQGLAILMAAEKTNSPVIIQASRGARAYAGDLLLQSLIKGLIATFPNIPFVCIRIMVILWLLV